MLAADSPGANLGEIAKHHRKSSRAVDLHIAIQRSLSLLAMKLGGKSTRPCLVTSYNTRSTGHIASNKHCLKKEIFLYISNMMRLLVHLK
jgi:hypothetical protein